MSKFIEKEVKCAICHKKVKIEVLISHYCPDIAIDGNQNNQIQYRAIQVCPECGYVSLDITQPVKKISSKKFLTSDNTLNYILKGADTYALNQNDVLASYMYRLASWKSLELKDRDLWKTYMNKSIRYLEKYLKEKNVLTEDDLSYFVILIDCYRQVSLMNYAKELCDEVLENISLFKNKQQIQMITKVIQFELTLISHSDTKVHYYHEVI